MAPAALIERYNCVAPDWGSRLLHLGYGAAYREFIRHVGFERKSGSHVCDIGTGSGTFSQAFLAENPGLSRLTLVDPSEKMLAQAKIALHAKCNDLRVHCQTLEQHQPQTRYDVVLVAHVIEHFSNPEDALRHLWSLVAPGGTLVMIVSRPHWCQWLIWLHWRHRWFSRQKICALAARQGMGDTDVFGFAQGAPKRTSLGYVFRKPNRDEKGQTC